VGNCKADERKRALFGIAAEQLLVHEVTLHENSLTAKQTELMVVERKALFDSTCISQRHQVTKHRKPIIMHPRWSR
jgi:hypothetical protein